MIGALITASVFCRFKKLDFWRAADLGAPIFALSYGIGRLGCFAAGCCYGKPTDLPWGVRFPEGGEAPFGVAIHPTQIYATLLELGTLAFLLWFERTKHRTKPKVGQVFGLWLVMHGAGRLVMEHFRDDFRGPRFLNLSVSTWISFAVMLGGVWILKFKKRTA
jgi:phosphatidylglycerol:prolipoprotein diacylglycerol transferase